SPGNALTGVPSTQKLYRNDGDGTFTDISASAGIDTANGGCAVVFSDFNDDWMLDILVANCGQVDTSGQQPVPTPGSWELWMNQGDLSFVDEAAARGLDVRPGFAQGITMADYDRDGDLDLFATGVGSADPFGAGGVLSQQVLFEKHNGAFYDKTEEADLLGYELALGAAFADFDADGDMDLATVGSSIAPPFGQLLGPLAGPGRVYENDGTGVMEDVIDLGLELQATSGLAVGDYDADGFVDMVIVKTAYSLETGPLGTLAGDGAPVLLHNPGNDNESLTIRLQGTQSNSMGIGARVRVSTPEGVQVQEVMAGSSFASTNSPWLTFGTGHRKWGMVQVYWPSGFSEGFIISNLDGMSTLVEGTGF
ncbi:MAG: CRTAC1 family protein, partial [Nannocystaceae bacterium]